MQVIVGTVSVLSTFLDIIVNSQFLVVIPSLVFQVAFGMGINKPDGKYDSWKMVLRGERKCGTSFLDIVMYIDMVI